LFGTGLVGASIAESLAFARTERPETLDFEWAHPERHEAQLGAVLAHLKSAECIPDRLAVVWAAGAGGFGATVESLRPETEAFGRVLGLAERLSEIKSVSNVSVHHLSSAGGLFEGQRMVTGTTAPAPLRPYAEAKLEQEALLSKLPLDLHKNIYRPSTVYGYQPGGRAGLILALIRNALYNCTTYISGDASTIRDFVHASDVGQFIARKILGADTANGTYLLASAKPTSMTEVITRVSRVLGRSLYLQFQPNPSNMESNSYLPSALPADWSCTDLSIGVRMTYDRVVRTEFLESQNGA